MILGSLLLHFHHYIYLSTISQALVVKQPSDPLSYLIQMLDNEKDIEEIINSVNEMSIPKK